MANLSDLFPSSGGGYLGGFANGAIADPRDFPKRFSSGSGGNMSLYPDDSATTAADSSTAFWTQIGLRGAYLTSAADDTYVTICDLTGTGRLWQVMGPVSTNSTDDHFIKITADGVETILSITDTHTVGPNQGRFLVGSLALDSRMLTAEPQGGRGFNSGGAGAAAKELNYNGSYYSESVTIIPPRYAFFRNLRYLAFAESLKVEVKVTDVLAGSNANYSGAVYELFED